MVDDQVLMKTDGFPTYHMAVVVDDHLMEITHVIRGEEWISSTPKHLLLYESFGWNPPEYAHLPLLRNPDKSKLSKRKNPTSILYYRQAGYLPEALINFLGLMAYSPADGEEMFSLEKMVSTFDLDRVSLGGPIFDLLKLRAFNGRYLRNLAPDALWARLKAWMLGDDTWTRIVPLAQPRLEQLSDFVPACWYLFADRLDYDASLLTGPADADAERVPRLLRIAQWEIEKTRTWDVESIQGVFNKISTLENIKLKDLMMTFYVAMSGRKVSLPAFDGMVIMGRDLCLRRLQYAIEILEKAGTVLSGKALKKIQKDYEVAYGKAD
jgi:glutamyl-tRNA synthetase